MFKKIVFIVFSISNIFSYPISYYKIVFKDGKYIECFGDYHKVEDTPNQESVNLLNYIIRLDKEGRSVDLLWESSENLDVKWNGKSLLVHGYKELKNQLRNVQLIDVENRSLDFIYAFHYFFCDGENEAMIKEINKNISLNIVLSQIEKYLYSVDKDVREYPFVYELVKSLKFELNNIIKYKNKKLYELNEEEYLIIKPAIMVLFYWFMNVELLLKILSSKKKHIIIVSGNNHIINIVNFIKLTTPYVHSSSKIIEA